jgi:hypothetical protein
MAGEATALQPDPATRLEALSGVLVQGGALGAVGCAARVTLVTRKAFGWPRFASCTAARWRKRRGSAGPRSKQGRPAAWRGASSAGTGTSRCGTNGLLEKQAPLRPDDRSGHLCLGARSPVAPYS